jgi:hypothetical protein
MKSYGEFFLIACRLRVDKRAKVNGAALGQAEDRTPATGAQSRNNMHIFQ